MQAQPPVTTAACGRAIHCEADRLPSFELACLCGALFRIDFFLGLENGLT